MQACYFDVIQHLTWAVLTPYSLSLVTYLIPLVILPVKLETLPYLWFVERGRKTNIYSVEAVWKRSNQTIGNWRDIHTVVAVGKDQIETVGNWRDNGTALSIQWHLVVLVYFLVNQYPARKRLILGGLLYLLASGKTPNNEHRKKNERTTDMSGN